MLYWVVRVLFSSQKTATKCVALQNFSKSQKMLYWMVRVLFPSQKTATKCVALQKYSKSQKMCWMHCYTEQQGKHVTTSQSELVFCQLAFLAEASKKCLAWKLDTFLGRYYVVFSNIVTSFNVFLLTSLHGLRCLLCFCKSPTWNNTKNVDPSKSIWNNLKGMSFLP